VIDPLLRRNVVDPAELRDFIVFSLQTAAGLRMVACGSYNVVSSFDHSSPLARSIAKYCRDISVQTFSPRLKNLQDFICYLAGNRQ
jgi:hypothetical protein